MLLATSIAAIAQQTTLQLDPTATKLTFTLDASLHVVHGSFQVKSTALQFDAATGGISGEIAVETRSGETGNGMRDRKMHKDVLESEQYTEIVFRPDHIEGPVASSGKSSVRVHGMFGIHGVEREITVPANIEMSGDRWSATTHFTIPYAKWGMKNPSTLFLRVSDSVEIDLMAAGSKARSNASNHGASQ